MKALLIYDSSISVSLAAAMIQQDYMQTNLSSGDTVTYKDLKSVVTGDVDTWITSITGDDYTEIHCMVESAPGASATAKLDTMQMYNLIAVLAAAYRGTTLDSQANSDIFSAVTIGKTGSGWTINAYAGKFVSITGGVGASQLAIITSNTADTLTIEGVWESTPDATSDFSVVDDDLTTSFWNDIASTSKKRALRVWDNLYPTLEQPKIVQYVSEYLWPYNGGVADSGAALTLTDATNTGYNYSAAFVADALIGWYIYIVAGTGSGQYRLITGNSTSVITVNYAWDTNPDNTSYYQIVRAEGEVFLTEAAKYAILTYFYDVDGAVPLANWRRITDLGKYTSEYQTNALAKNSSPYQDLTYLHEDLLVKGRAVYDHSII